MFSVIRQHKIPIPTPVSYTHLDVYKRQAQECMKYGVQEEHIYVSFERKMSCALGKCGHCKINETYVCLEGPVFPYTKAKTLMD